MIENNYTSKTISEVVKILYDKIKKIKEDVFDDLIYLILEHLLYLSKYLLLYNNVLTYTINYDDEYKYIHVLNR